MRGRDRSDLALRVAACALLAATAAAAGQEAAEPGAAFEEALARLDIPAALREYASAKGTAEESRVLLGRIARADLEFCLTEGKLWDRLEAARVLTELGDEAGRGALIALLSSDHAAMRIRATDLAVELGVAGAAPVLATAVADAGRQPFERLRGARALHGLGKQERAIGIATQLSTSETALTRRQAVEALDAFRDPAAGAALRQRLDDEDWAVRLTAAKGLLALGEEAGRQALQAALAQRENPRARLVAAWFLGLGGDRSGLEPVREMVEAGLAPGVERDAVDYKVELATYILSWIDPDAARPFLVQLANGEWMDGRLLAARRLAELGDPAALPALEKLLGHRAEEIGASPYRADAVRYAGWLGDRPEVRQMARRALEDIHEHVRLQGLTVLARLGDESVLPALRELLGVPSLQPRVQAAELLLLRWGAGAPEPEPFLEPFHRGLDGG